MTRPSDALADLSALADYQPKRRMKRPEEALQRQVAAYLNAAYPGLTWWHTANGMGRSRAEAGILKAMGVKAGVPDLTIIMPTGSAAFIELKAAKGRLSESQKAFRDGVQACGCFWAECRSLAEVAGTLDAWLGPLGHKAKARIAA